MAVVMLQAGDGGKAMLGFTGLDALQAWEPSARPVPVTLDKAAQTARAEGAVAVLVDWPVRLAGAGRRGARPLAAGHRLVETSPESSAG